jgi:bisphosphoglycerate-independent phosphoglycerate mutase (AlkP superfamily)
LTQHSRSFRQTDITRAVRAVKAAGVECKKIEVDPATGKIVIVTADVGGAEQKADLDAWMKKHAHST